MPSTLSTYTSLASTSLSYLTRYILWSYSFFLRAYSLSARLARPFVELACYAFAPVIQLGRQVRGLLMGVWGVGRALVPSVELYTFFSTALVIGLTTGAILAFTVHILLPRPRPLEAFPETPPPALPDRPSSSKYQRDRVTPPKKRDLLTNRPPRYLADTGGRSMGEKVVYGRKRGGRSLGDLRGILEEE